MYAGVILYLNGAIFKGCGVPRVCGGDPTVRLLKEGDWKVFPVYAGVILFIRIISKANFCVPRVCGGDPSKPKRA